MSIIHTGEGKSSQTDLLHIATINKPYGVKGWLWVYSHTQVHSDIFAMHPWYVKTAIGMRPITVREWRTQGKGLVACFDEIADRDMAQSMLGAKIFCPKDQLPKAGEDEYYWQDLQGLSVVNMQGELLGKIAELFETGANDVMRVVATEDSIDKQSRLIPWHKSVVLEVKLGMCVLVDWQADY